VLILEVTKGKPMPQLVKDFAETGALFCEVPRE
jgi:hypothetical protein